jgi:hypothetical protein
MATCYLVSCVSRKAPGPVPAEALYVSDWFVKARAYVHAHLQPGDQWFILSAEHQRLEPTRVVAHYDKSLSRMSKAERQEWGRKVVKQLIPRLSHGDNVIILAGSRYRSSFVQMLLAEGYEVTVPMEKLPIGKQLAWLKVHLEAEVE